MYIDHLYILFGEVSIQVLCSFLCGLFGFFGWGTVPSMGNVAQAPLGKPVGSEVGRQDPRPWISSPVGNQACIVLRLL